MLKGLLQFAPVYNSFKTVINRVSIEQMVDQYIRPRPGDAVLDIGCGPATILASLPDVRYIGFDPSAAYIAAARERYGSGGDFRVGTCSSSSLPAAHSMDLVMAIGVLHHVNDSEALSIFQTAKRALKAGGRFFSLDGCFVPNQSWVAKALLRMDRGEHVREAAAYQSLASSVFSNVKANIRHDMMRVPYTHILMECS